MPVARTSQSHPLQIASVQAGPDQGRIGITFCPGKQDPFAHTGAWARDLDIDLDAIAAWGAKLVLTLVEPEELHMLKVPNLGEGVQQRGLAWRHLPIADFSIPTQFFERQWLNEGHLIRERLRQGEDVLIHCKGGLGRAGMMAARLLVELGMEPKAAIRQVRRERPGAIETPAQLALVRRTTPQDRVIDVGRMHRIGGQLGTNPAGLYEDELGRRYYVKTLESHAHARNEFLAAQLYRLAGAPTLTYVRTLAADQIATQWIDLDEKCVAHLSESHRRQAQQWLGVHAWTANWDVAGYNGDNQGLIDGQVLTLDVGGALAFRAQGDPKGRAFGTEVKEIDLLRTEPDNPHAVRLFGEMTAAGVDQAIQKVTAIPDEEIRRVILNNGGSVKLVEKMIARKADMIGRLGYGTRDY